MVTTGPAASLALSHKERKDLTNHEAVIDRGLATFVEVGAALAAIREQQLYRETHSSFEAYVRDRWKMSRPRAYQLIEAANIVADLSTLVDTALPTTERAARAIAPLVKEDAGAAAEVLESVGPGASAKVIAEQVTLRRDRQPATGGYFVDEGGAVESGVEQLVERGIIYKHDLADLPPQHRAQLVWELLRADEELSVEHAHWSLRTQRYAEELERLEKSNDEADKGEAARLRQNPPMAISRAILRRFAREAVERIHDGTVTLAGLRRLVRADERVASQSHKKVCEAFLKEMAHLNFAVDHGRISRAAVIEAVQAHNRIRTALNEFGASARRYLEITSRDRDRLRQLVASNDLSAVPSSASG